MNQVCHAACPIHGYRCDQALLHRQHRSEACLCVWDDYGDIIVHRGRETPVGRMVRMHEVNLPESQDGREVTHMTRQQNTRTEPAWSFDQTGSLDAIEDALRRGDEFGSDKSARIFQDAAIEYISQAATENGARVVIREGYTPTGQRYVNTMIVNLPLLLPEGEAQRQRQAREMAQ